MPMAPCWQGEARILDALGRTGTAVVVVAGNPEVRTEKTTQKAHMGLQPAFAQEEHRDSQRVGRDAGLRRVHTK